MNSATSNSVRLLEKFNVSLESNISQMNIKDKVLKTHEKKLYSDKKLLLRLDDLIKKIEPPTPVEKNEKIDKNENDKNQKQENSS